MEIIASIADLKIFVKEAKSKGHLGLVPTMGALHLGHLSLVEQSKKENKNTLATIFVNPTQFDQESDLVNYPKTLDKDVEVLRKEGCNAVFAPSVKEVYPNGLIKKSYDFGSLTQYMEGATRDGHFNGVGTIVEKLFLLTTPNVAYFGEKDFQQLQIVRMLTQQMNMGIKIVGCPIVREANGLAMSSRNERLSKKARANANLIYQTLLDAKTLFSADKKLSAIKDFVKKAFDKSSMQLDYFDIVDEANLIPFRNDKNIENKRARAFIAVFLEGIRLIDNLPFHE